MKQRIISAFIAAILLIPIVLLGGIVYKIGVIALGLVALYELVKAKETENKVPIFMKVVLLIIFLLGLLNGLNVKNPPDLTNYIILSIISLLLGIVLYKDNKKYNLADATYLSLVNLFLVLSFCMLLTIRESGIYYLLIIALITICSDTFALIVGKLIGKHKLIKEISPNKTIEGFVGGLVFCLIICVPTYITILDYNGNILLLILMIAFLSIVSTLGDLVFSAIKRYFKIKDYGNIMPGHGGAMDRLDSFLFVLLVFRIIMSLL